VLLPFRCQGGKQYSFYLFLTSAPDGGEWSVSCPGSALPLGNEPWYPLDGLQSWSGHWRLEKKSFASAGDRTSIIQSVVRHYTRGGYLDQLQEPHFRRQQSAKAMYYLCDKRLISIFNTTHSYESLYLTLTFIKSKHRSVLTDKLLTEL
jgi:hypothetical protein